MLTRFSMRGNLKYAVITIVGLKPFFYIRKDNFLRIIFLA
jgi:hypothetical protein